MKHFAIAAIFALLTACAGGGSLSPQQSASQPVSGSVRSANAAPTFARTAASSAHKIPAYTRVNSKLGSSAIYVADCLGDTVTTYGADGSGPILTISPGFGPTCGVAVDAKGKIFVANYTHSTITTYDSRGRQIHPTITDGVNYPWSIAVGPDGKLHVVNIGDNQVTTYDSHGKRIAPTISLLTFPQGLAVGQDGKIYVSSNLPYTYGIPGGEITTYDANGNQITPTITIDATSTNSGPVNVGVDSQGNIYVLVYSNGVTGRLMTYGPDGSPKPPTITQNLVVPTGIAVDQTGKIYVGNYEGAAPGPGANGSVTTYLSDGTPTTPTIINGINGATNMAVSNP